MADRIFNLPQTRGSFEMAGKVTGTQRSNFYNEKETPCPELWCSDF